MADTRLTDKNALTTAASGDLLHVVANLDISLNSIFLIGHNPSLNVLAEYLTNSYIANIPTCGVLAMDLNINSWSDVSEGCADIEFFDYPKNYTVENIEDE